MAIVIDIKLNNAPSAEGKINRLSLALEKARANAKGLTDQIDRLAVALNRLPGSALSIRVPSAGGGGGGGSRAGGGSKPLTPPVTGVTDKSSAAYAKSYIDWVDSQGANVSPAMLKSRNAMLKSLNRWNANNDPQTVLARALARTRFTKGGAGLPLGVDIAKVGSMLGKDGLSALFGAGGAGEAGAASGLAVAGLAAGLTAAAAAAAACAAAMMSLKNAANEASDMTTVMGSNGSAVVSRDAFAPGLSGASRRSLSGLQGAIAAGYGLSPITGIGGDMDYASRQRRIMEIMLNAKSDRERQIIAEVFPEAAPLGKFGKYLDQGTKARMLEGAAPISEEDKANSAKFEANQIIFGQNMGRLGMAVGAPILQSATDFFEVVNKASGAVGGLTNLVKGLTEFAISGNGVTGPLATLLKIVNGLTGGGAVPSEDSKNIKRSADALDVIAAGVSGGRGRAKGFDVSGLGLDNFRNRTFKDYRRSLL